MAVKRAPLFDGRLHSRRRQYRCHQVVIPFARHLEVGYRAQLKGFDQVMIDIGVDARLPERVEGCRCRTAPE